MDDRSRARQAGSERGELKEEEADLYRASPRSLDAIWRQVSAAWQERSARRKEPPAEIHHLILLGEIQLWVILPHQQHLTDWRAKPQGIILTWPSGHRLTVHVVGGRGLTTWARIAAERLDAIRRQRSLEGCDVYARTNWLPYLRAAFTDAGLAASFLKERELAPPRLKRSA